MKFNKINFGLLMFLFLCRFENILGTSDKNIEEGLKEKYKIVDLNGTTLKNEKGEDFSFIITCEYNRKYYKYSEKIESFIENIKKEEAFDKRSNMENELEKKSGVSFSDNIVKTKDGRVLVVKDKIKNKVYLVFGIYDKDSYNIIYDIIEENKTASVVIGTGKECGGELLNEENNLRKFKIVCCELKEVKPGFPLEKLDNFDENSCCCDCLCN